MPIPPCAHSYLARGEDSELDPKGAARLRRFHTTVALLLAAVIAALPWLDGDGALPATTLLLLGAAAGVCLCTGWRLDAPAVRVLAASGLLVCLGWGSLAWSQCPAATVAAAGQMTSLVLLFALLHQLIVREGAFRWLAAGLSLSILVSLLPAVAQLTAGAPTPTHWLDPQYLDTILTRVSGPTDNPNAFAGYLSYALPLCLAIAAAQGGWLGWAAATAGAGATACLLLTYSRSGWLAASLGCLPVVAGILLDRRRGVRSRLLPALCALMLVLASYPAAMSLRATTVPNLRHGTLVHRLFLWQAGVAMLQRHPVGGVGLGCYETTYCSARPTGVMRTGALVRAPGSAHSDYIQWLSETGIAGLLVALGAVALLRSAMWRPSHGPGTHPGEHHLRTGAWGTLIAAALGGIAQSNLQTPICGAILAIAIALIVTGARTVRPALEHPIARRVRPAVGVMALLAAVPLMASMAASHLNEAATDAAHNWDLQKASRLLHWSSHLAPWGADAHCLVGDICAAAADLDSADRQYTVAAERAYRRAIALDPLSAMLRCKLADIVEKRGSVAGALESYETACDLDWYKASYHLQAGRLAADVGLTRRARQHLTAATDLFPLELALLADREQLNSTYAWALRRAHSDAVLRLEHLPHPGVDTARHSSSRKTLTKGFSPQQELELLSALHDSNLHHAVGKVGVASAGGSSAALIRLQAQTARDSGLSVLSVEQDALRCLEIAFRLPLGLEHVDVWITQPEVSDTGLQLDRPLFSCTAQRDAYLSVASRKQAGPRRRLLSGGPVRYDPVLAGLTNDWPFGTHKGPAGACIAPRLADRCSDLGNEPSHASARGQRKANKPPRVLAKALAHGNKVALTIDDGPRPLVTPLILDTLKRAEVRATFFVVGKKAEEFPGLLQAIAGAGHDIGNHTYSHHRLANLLPSQVRAEIIACSTVIQETTGIEPRFMRPPGAMRTRVADDVAVDLGLTTVLCSRNASDWKTADVEAIIDNATRRVGPGDIILMHQGGPHSAVALAGILSRLDRRGLRVVPLSEMSLPENG